MRSFIFKSALAAILVSTSLVGFDVGSAAAKSDRGSHGSQSAGRADDSGYFDHMTMGPATLPLPTRPAQAAGPAARTAELKPRLAQIAGEIGVAHRRIAVDQRLGALKPSQARILEVRAHNIRKDAVQTAENHRGALPKAKYEVLQQRVAKLNNEIHHDATT